MKKKIFSVFFALVLVLSFSLVTAVPVAAGVVTSTFNVTDGRYTTVMVDAENGEISATLTGSWGDSSVIGDFTATGTGGLYVNKAMAGLPPEPPWGTTATISVNGTLSAVEITFSGTAVRTEGDPISDDEVTGIAGTIIIQLDGVFVAELTGTVFAGTENELPITIDISGSMVRPITNERTEVSFFTIQLAIDAAETDDTIDVAAGTYNEQVVINKQLTLNGANATVNAVTGARGSESIIDGGDTTAITISADNVIVDGFTLDGGITLDDTANPISGGAISNNIITGADNDEEPIKPQNGIRLGFDIGLGVDGITIENNTIINSRAKGIRFANPKFGGGMASDITISGNEIKDNGSAGIETYGPGLNTIINNIISGNDGNGINLKFDDGDVVTGNTITNNTGPGITLRQVTNTVVENNSVSGHVSGEVIGTCDTVFGGKGSGIHIFDTSENNTIRFNDISGNNYGIFIHSKDDLQPSGNSINFNNILDNTFYGILNALVDPPAPVDATNNWWGDAAGPSHAGNPYNDPSEGDAVSDNVDYIPWMIHTELQQGWNIYSTPIACGDTTDTITEALDLWTTDSTKVTAAYCFDGSSQAFAVTTATDFDPMVPIYLNMTAAATIDVISSTSNTAPPSQTMYAGWNLIGLAELYSMDAEDALASAYYVAGANNIGYSQAVSPGLGQTAWSAIRGAAIDTASNETMLPTEGYWVNMVNQGILAGFTSTPITELP